MKRTLLVAASLMLSILIAGSVRAQVRPTTLSPGPATQKPPATNAPLPDTRIAVVDTGAFADEKTGITRFVNAVKSLEREFQARQTELTGIQTRIKTLADEINKLSATSVVDPKTIQAKQDEGERLQRDLKYKKEQADADFSKRYEVVITPISNDIGKALEQFANQRGITMLFDISKLAPAVLSMSQGVDMTRAFIDEYNSKNP